MTRRVSASSFRSLLHCPHALYLDHHGDPNLKTELGEFEHVPITDGRELVMPRYTEPETEQAMILEKLSLQLPKQPPPRIRSGEIIMPPDPST